MPQQRKSERSTRGLAIPESLLARLDLPTRTFALKWIPKDDTPNDPSLLLAPTPALRGIDLTALTTEELDMFEAFVRIAIDSARPIVARLDAEAQHDYEHGLGINRRLYRPPAQLLNFGTPPPVGASTTNPTNGDQHESREGDDRGVPRPSDE